MIVILIPAKGGSSRLPNKNIAMLNGRRMIEYSIDCALESNLSDAIYVTTDSDDIEDIAVARGIQVIRRPLSLGGDVPMIEVYRHAIKQIDHPDIELIVGLQPDHPDRNVSVDEAIGIFRREGVDRLVSQEADGTKNGAHCIHTRACLESGIVAKNIFIVDDCTNVHFQDDLDRASERLKAK
jgi:CMP-N,N'-diacetyllegionaminic acid synthase